MNLDMRSEVREGRLVIALSGELTLTESPAFKAWVANELDGAPSTVEVDCRNLQYIDSTGLGSLIYLRKAALDRGGTLRLTSVSGWLRKFLQVTGLEKTFVAGHEDPSQPERQS